MKNVFISFSSKQTKEAERICGVLEATGITCFISTRDLVPGEEYASQLLNHIDDADVLVLLLSKDSNDSPHVLREVEYAVSHKTPILVYALEEVKLSKSMEYFLMTHQWITGEGNLDNKLIKSVNHLIIKKNSDSAEEISSSTVSKPSSKNKSPLTTALFFIAAFGLVLIVILSLIIVVGIKNKNNALNETNNANLSVVSSDFQVGDYLTFGTYYNEPISWRVLKTNDDGTVILISENILTMKIYDAAEGGTYGTYDGVDYISYENHIIEDMDLQIKVRGNNNWAQSNIRTWLNSDKEIVDYLDQAPTRIAAGNNFYDSEAGFLNGFTDTERNAIMTVNHSGSEDKVFLLSSNELSWFREADIQLYAKPTETCEAHDNEHLVYESFQETYNTDYYYWWLRDSSSDKANEANVVNPDTVSDKVSTSSVGIFNCGIRPAICVDPTKLP